MQAIILLVGDSGSGKDFVLEIASEYDGLEVVKRYSSREKRNGENSISSYFNVPIDEIKSMNYYYEGVQKGNFYGIKKEDLENVLNEGKTPMVICPSFENFIDITNDFKYAEVIPFFIYRGIDDYLIDEWTKSLLDRGSSMEEIENRKNKRSKYFEELYVNHADMYASNVILNIYDLTTEDDIRLQIEGLCEKNNIDIEPNSKKTL